MHDFSKVMDAIEWDSNQGLLSATREGLHFAAPRYCQIAGSLKAAGFAWVCGKWFAPLSSYEDVRKILKNITPEMCAEIPRPSKFGIIAREWRRYNCPVTSREFRPWCARIIGPHPKYKLEREFMKGELDMHEANSVGSRGVRILWHVPAGQYQVKGNEFFAVDEFGVVVSASAAEVMESVNA